MLSLTATLALMALSALTTADTARGEQEDSSESYLSTTDDGLPPDEPPLGPSLGEILGLVALVITILYIFGISWKVVKIYKGEYVPTEPVYLKYK